MFEFWKQNKNNCYNVILIKLHILLWDPITWSYKGSYDSNHHIIINSFWTWTKSNLLKCQFWLNWRCFWISTQPSFLSPHNHMCKFKCVEWNVVLTMAFWVKRSHAIILGFANPRAILFVAWSSFSKYITFVGWLYRSYEIPT